MFCWLAWIAYLQYHYYQPLIGQPRRHARWLFRINTFLSLLQTSTNSANRAYLNNVQKSCALTHFYCTDDKWKLENETAFGSLMRRIKVRSSFFFLSRARALLFCVVFGSDFERERERRTVVQPPENIFV